MWRVQINIPPTLSTREEVIIDVTFALDINDILKVNAEDTTGGETTYLAIKMDNIMDEVTIEEFIKKAEEMEEDDKKYLEKIKTELQGIALILRTNGTENPKKKVKEIFKWIKINVDASKEKIEEQLNEIKIYKIVKFSESDVLGIDLDKMGD